MGDFPTHGKVNRYAHRSLATDRDAWERQPGETSKAFVSFQTYLRMDPFARSLAATAEALGKSASLMQEWSSRWSWTARARAWEDFQFALDQEERRRRRAERVAAMDDRQEELGRRFTEVAASRVAAAVEAMQQDGGAVAEITLVEAARIAEIGSRLERLAVGETTSRTEVKGVSDFVGSVLRVALKHVPADRREAFLIDIEATAGWGALAGDEG